MTFSSRIASRATVEAYVSADREAVLALSLSAWAPVLEQTRGEVPAFVWAAFYPEGWDVRQHHDIGEYLDAEGRDEQATYVARCGDEFAGFVGTRWHPEDSMLDVHVLAVEPRFQRQGIAKDLLARAEARARELHATMLMVETVGDTGHRPARRLYESQGFERWPVARYFRPVR